MSTTKVARRATPEFSSSRPYWRAASRFQSLRIGNSTPSCSRNARFDQVLSTLTPSTLVLAVVNAPCVVWYCFISLVQPGENAAGKNATTTFCLPLKSESLMRFCSYFGGVSLPSPAGANQARSKSGAGSPTLTDGGGGGGGVFAGACGAAA